MILVRPHQRAEGCRDAMRARVIDGVLDEIRLVQILQAQRHGTLQLIVERFEDNIVAFMSLVEAAKNYPCIKKAWVEFLGERPDPVTERVE